MHFQKIGLAKFLLKSKIFQKCEESMEGILAPFLGLLGKTFSIRREDWPSPKCQILVWGFITILTLSFFHFFLNGVKKIKKKFKKCEKSEKKVKKDEKGVHF